MNWIDWPLLLVLAAVLGVVDWCCRAQRELKGIEGVCKKQQERLTALQVENERHIHALATLDAEFRLLMEARDHMLFCRLMIGAKQDETLADAIERVAGISQNIPEAHNYSSRGGSEPSIAPL